MTYERNLIKSPSFDELFNTGSILYRTTTLQIVVSYIKLFCQFSFSQVFTVNISIKTISLRILKRMISTISSIEAIAPQRFQQRLKRCHVGKCWWNPSERVYAVTGY